MKQLTEGTSWESVKTKYDDILNLFRDELPENEQQAANLVKDYPHKREQITNLGHSINKAEGYSNQISPSMLKILLFYYCLLIIIRSRLWEEEWARSSCVPILRTLSENYTD